MLEADLAVIGAGPAGLSAAIEASKRGVNTILIDENRKAGGQLFKQIHKFFGSKAHHAGVRGYDIGKKLLQEAKENNVTIWLDSIVYGVFSNKMLGVKRYSGEHILLKPKKIVFATGASENAISFHGWTLPGVMGAGAVQTMVNLHRVLPGKKFIIVGSGNVGLIVAYQLLQAGAEVVAVLEALPQIGGYKVHAAKIVRAGVPILTSCTIKEARGKEGIKEVVIGDLDKKLKIIPGTERTLKIDIVCLAVGLTPLIELSLMAGCKTTYISQLGGRVPIHNKNMETTKVGVFVAGDTSGIEEASTALDEGRLAGVAIAESLGYLKRDRAERLKVEIRERLKELRMGPYGNERQKAKEEILRKWRDQVEGKRSHF